ncbi:hypothetical protein C8J56DRAFT_1059581 [Mycena floridula]|nr:hypothetical protein C8J56DRAFT_1059581 [Mycena floridula]
MSSPFDDDPRKGCTPFVHPVRSSGKHKWYLLGSGPKAGLYQSWQVCESEKGEHAVQKCTSREDAFREWRDLCLAVHSHALEDDFDSFQDPLHATADPRSPGIPSPGTIRGSTTSSAPSKSSGPKASSSKSSERRPAFSEHALRAGKSTWRAPGFGPVEYFVVRGQHSAFQCSDRHRARLVYEEAVSKGEDVEMLVTDDEEIASNYCETGATSF